MSDKTHNARKDYCTCPRCQQVRREAFARLEASLTTDEKLSRLGGYELNELIQAGDQDALRVWRERLLRRELDKNFASQS